MTKAQFIEVVGTPTGTRTPENIESLVYNIKKATHAGRCAKGWPFFGIEAPVECSRETVEYLVQLHNGKVTTCGRLGDFDLFKHATL